MRDGNKNGSRFSTLEPYRGFPTASSADLNPLERQRTSQRFLDGLLRGKRTGKSRCGIAIRKTIVAFYLAKISIQKMFLAFSQDVSKSPDFDHIHADSGDSHT